MELLDREHYYDFQVPVYENYWALGTWHHNTGKSATAKCVGEALGRPLLRLDIGAVFNQFVGASEGNIRAAIKQAEAMAPCAVWVN